MEKKEKIRGRDQKNHLGEIELNLLLYQKDRNQISEKLLSWLQYGTAQMDLCVYICNVDALCLPRGWTKVGALRGDY